MSIREVVTLVGGVNCGRTLSGLQKVIGFASLGKQLIFNDEDDVRRLHYRLQELSGSEDIIDNVVIINPESITMEQWNLIKSWVDNGEIKHILVDCTQRNSQVITNAIYGMQYEGHLTTTVVTNKCASSKHAGLHIDMKPMERNLNKMFGAMTSHDVPTAEGHDISEAFVDLLAGRVAEKVRQMGGAAAMMPSDDSVAVPIKRTNQYVAYNPSGHACLGPMPSKNEMVAHVEAVLSNESIGNVVVKYGPGEDEMVPVLEFDTHNNVWTSL